MLKEDNYSLALSGAGVLLFRQTVLLQRLPSMWSHLSSDVMAVEIFAETFLHGVLLISLLIEPRWRFMLTFWLYFSYWLIAVEVFVAVVSFLSGLWDSLSY